MNILIRHQNSELRPEQKMVIDEFLKFHQRKVPLRNDIEVLFMGERLGRMTTGSRTDKRVLKILSRNRMLIDILRTLSHELTHQYQHENMDLDFSQDIGGKAEDMANSVSGTMLKLFQKERPELMGIIYE